jgi:hypothetical protein
MRRPAASPSSSADPVARAARAGWLALWRAMRVYHRYEVRGFEHLEVPGTALLVGYHGQGLAFDQCMLSVTIFERLGYLPSGVINRVVDAPGLRRVADGLGFVTGDGPAIAAAVARGEHVMVQPGGTREACRSLAQRYRVEWGERAGYVRLALRHRMRIIPIAGAGVDGGYVGLNDGTALNARLGLPRHVPLWLAVGLGVWPFALPLPVKMTTVIGPPIDPRAAGVVDERDREGVARLHRQVAAAVQGLLDRANRRAA